MEPTATAVGTDGQEEKRTETVACDLVFRPFGAFRFYDRDSHGSRRGLYPCAARRLDSRLRTGDKSTFRKVRERWSSGLGFGYAAMFARRRVSSARRCFT